MIELPTASTIISIVLYTIGECTASKMCFIRHTQTHKHMLLGSPFLTVVNRSTTNLQNVIDMQEQLSDLNCKSVHEKKLLEASIRVLIGEVSGPPKIWLVKRFRT